MRPTPSKLLAHAQVPYLLITDLTNIRYLCGISVSSGAVIVTPKEFRLFVDARYSEMAAHHAKKPVKVMDRSKFAKYLLSLPACGFEEQKVSVADLRNWKTKYKHTKFVRTENAVEHFRRQKDPAETKLLKKAIGITKELMEHVPFLLQAGITEKEVAWALEADARALGAEGFSFDPIVAFGANSSRPHHRAGDAKLKKTDIVQIDIGVFYKGYSSDMSRVFFMGKPSRQQAEAMIAVAQAKDAAMKAAKEGIAVASLDAIARDILREYGMEKHFTHALGHGVGLEVHEGVTVSQRDARALLSGEVIAIEPGVYFPGKFGIRLEDMVFVT